MNVVDKNEDTEKLEEIFAVEIIELFIQNLAGQLEIIDYYRKLKMWDCSDEEKDTV
jgi:hypothetical protein